MKLYSRKSKLEFSKRLIHDIRRLLWIVTIGGLALSAYCIFAEYMGGLPWLTAMVGLPWSAHGVVCSFYLNMAKSDHKVGGITFETAMNAISTNTPEININDACDISDEASI